MPLIEMNLTLQPVIDRPPMPIENMYETACAADKVTIKSWTNEWTQYPKDNFDRQGKWEHTCLDILGKEAYKPVIVAGSGPSLVKNYEHLKDRKREDGSTLHGRGDIKIVSCLHNFNFFEDHDVMGPDDYYVTLDSGEICVKEVWEGGKHSKDWYWERTKDRTLVAYVGTSPALIDKWRGKILWFASRPANETVYKATSDFVPYHSWPMFSTGGTVAGAALYLARAVLGAGVIIFIGMDFCFSYTHKFHPWESPYDQKFSGVMPCVDIWGNRVWTWASYWRFKLWFDLMACGGEGAVLNNSGNAHLVINATEGGLLGAYPEGVIKQIIQMDLTTALHIFNIHKRMPEAIQKTQVLY